MEKEHQIKLQPEVAKAVEDLGYTEWTDIQKKSIPLIQHGKDLIGQSHTGSGKTAAFGLPIIEKVLHRDGLQALILVPTRELCEQVTGEMQKFSKHKRLNIMAVYGGVSIEPQIHNLRNADIVIGTPGRILDHAQRGTMKFNRIKILVLDEADKMFEMGFVDDIKRIISLVPRERQTLLFSATISGQVMEIVKHYMKNPEKIKVKSYVDEGKLIQYYYDIDPRDKFSLLVHELKHGPEHLTMIFCSTRHMVDILSSNLYKQGIRSYALHGGLPQGKRKEAIEMFHSKKVNILVASDVAARGLDIKNVSHVINYDIPRTSKEYIHRIGRTARAGSEGKVISLLSPTDHENFRRVLQDRSINVEKLKLPNFQRVPFVMQSRERSHEGFRGPRRYDRSRGGSRRPPRRRY